MSFSTGILKRQRFEIGEEVICVNDTQEWISVADHTKSAGPQYGEPCIVESYFQNGAANFMTLEGHDGAFDEKYFIKRNRA